MDPVSKVQIDELNATYNELKSRLASIQNELFAIGVKMGSLQEKMAEAKIIPRTFNDKVNSEKALRPIKMRSMGITGIFPHPVDAYSPWNSDSDPAWSE